MSHTSGEAVSANLLRVCAWCQRVELGGEWAQLQEAVTRLRLSELPRRSHGICEGCFAQIVGTLAAAGLSSGLEPPAAAWRQAFRVGGAS
jgi:hypothetical protein